MMASTNSNATKADQESEGSIQNTADMTAFVQNLLVQMKTRFEAMSEGVIAKIDDMGSKIDQLEQSINDLKAVTDAISTGKSNPGAKIWDEPC